MRALPLAAAIAATLLASCGEDRAPGDSAKPDPISLPGDPVAFGFLNPGDDSSGIEPFSSYLAPVRLVVRDQAALEDAWATFYSQRAAPPPAPRVDFNQGMVVIVSIGATGGNRSMRVPLVTRLWDGSVAVAVEERRLGRSCPFAPAETRPAAAILLPRSDAPVFFGEFLTIVECE